MSKLCLSQIFSHSPALEVRSSCTEDGSALGSNPPSVSPTSLAPHYPYPGKTAFFVHPASCSSYYSCLMFGPSHSNGSGSMASADWYPVFSQDPCHFNPISQSEFPVFRSNGRSPQIRTLTFSAYLSHLLLQPLKVVGVCPTIASGFVAVLPTHPASQPLIGFLFITCTCASAGRSQICLRLPPDPPHDDALAFS